MKTSWLIDVVTDIIAKFLLYGLRNVLRDTSLIIGLSGYLPKTNKGQQGNHHDNNGYSQTNDGDDAKVEGMSCVLIG